MVRLLIFGASTTAGAWDKEGGWANRLIKFIFNKVIDEDSFYGFAYNLGISGDTTEDLIERMEFETKMRIKETEETVFVIDIGANDSQFIQSKNSIRTTPEEFKKNVQKIIDIARKFSKKIVILGNCPVDDTKTQPIPWAPDKSYKNEYNKKYNDLKKSVCKENDILFIDIFEKFSKGLKNNLSHDGLHPNTQGHKMIFEVVKDFLIENKLLEE